MHKTILLFLITLSFNAYADEYKPSAFKQNLNPKTYEDSSRSRKESWAYLSFVVNLDGEPENIKVISSSKSKNKKARAIQYVENLRYTPAIRDGKLIKTERTFLLKLQKSLWGNPNDGISVYFSRLYDEANKLIKAGDFEKAKPVLLDLKENKVKNLTEQAYYSWLSSLYYSRTKDWAEYESATHDAWVLREKLTDQFAYIVTKNLFDYALYDNQFQLALDVLQSMKRLNGVMLTADSYEVQRRLIVESLTSYTDIEKRYVIDNDETSVYHRIAKKHIHVQASAGKIESIELRCRNYFQLINLTSEVEVPATSKDCKLLIEAPQGTTFSVKETGKNILFN